MADMKAIQLGGGAAFRAGLLKVSMSGPVFAEAVTRYYLPDLNIGGPPVSDRAALMRQVYERAAPATLKQMRNEAIDSERASPYDSHPPTQMRLDYAAASADGVGGSIEPVATLFDEWEEINAFVMEDFNAGLRA
jgi:hypothetical protein